MVNVIGESIEKKVIIEEFIGGVEVSVETISWKGKHYILSITDKVTTNAPFFVELEHHQPSNLTIEIQNRIKEFKFKSKVKYYFRIFFFNFFAIN